MAKPYKLGTGIEQYKAGSAQYCTLVITEQCNLRCKYCYEVGKNGEHVMPREVAYRAIDFFFEFFDPSEAIVLDFTGGECFLEVELMRDIIEYFKGELRKRPNHPWQSAYRIMIGSNGVLYNTEKVQHLVWENIGHCYPAITIDGTKRKHDAARIFPDGSGSYDIVSQNALLWLKQFPYAGTKMTFGSPDLPYVAESVVHVWEMGIKNVAANAVFESVWKPGDPELYESQLKLLADIALERGFWKTHTTNLFWIPNKLKPLEEDDDRNWCGTGKMISVDSRGNMYPCLRFQGFCIGSKPGRPTGNIYDGFHQDVLRTYHCLKKSLQSPKECLTCEMRDQCAWCSGLNYDAADSDTVFQRAIFICEMHKARWRANQYYWQKLEEKHGIKPTAADALEMVVGCPI